MEELSASSSSGEKRNWSELPSHLLDIIMDKLTSPKLFLSDYIRFGAVCDSWNSAFCDHHPPSHQFPTLLHVVPPSTRNNKKKKEETRLHRFYNISDEKIDCALEEVRMPSYRRCCGSSHGWLITVDVDDEDSDFAVRLFNPFLSTNGNGIEILLPSLKTLTMEPEFDLQCLQSGISLVRAVLSANPLTNPTDYTVMAIYGTCSRLAFFKPGNKHWTCIKPPPIMEGLNYFRDVMYCHMYGKFFAVNIEWAVVAISDDDVGREQGGKGGMIAKLVIQPHKIFTNHYKIFTKTYFINVESSGRELLKVLRFVSKDQAMDGETIYTTTGFSVFKLKATVGAKEEEEYKWQEVKSLCGDSMFLSRKTSISIRASDYPGCKPNSVHYSNDYDGCLRLDIGIFNLEDGSFKRYLPIPPKNTSAPIWIQPSLPNKNRRSSSS